MTDSPPKRSLLKKLLFLLIVLSLGLVAVWFSLWAAPDHELSRPIKKKEGKIEALQAWPHFPKQGPNECGAFSLSYGLKLVLNQPNAPKEMVSKVSHSFSWSEGLSGTVPWKITKEAGANGLQSRHYSALSELPEQRLALLCQHIDEQSPVLVLINSDRGIQHYILVVGFDEDAIHIYDPNLEADKDDPERTIDQNGAKAGNRSYSWGRFQEVWGQGGMIGLYRWWYLPLKKSADKN